jgi:hydroxymethylpyrimidine pyrophosphatase-like HAD family hydrolase
MGNAISEVKAAAHQVIGNHRDDSVLRFIEADWRRP